MILRPAPRRWARALTLLTAFLTAAALTAVPSALSPAVSAPATAPNGSPDDYDGSQMWLRYVEVSDPALLAQYRAHATAIVVDDVDAHPVYRHTSDLHMYPGSQEHLVTTTLQAARDELVRGLGGLLDEDVPVTTSAGGVPDGAVVVGTPASSPVVRSSVPAAELAKVGDEGYVVRSVTRGGDRYTVVAGNTDIAALYGTFAFLRLLQTQKPITGLDIDSSPKVQNRWLDNWETTRLYAGNNASGTGGLNGENGTIFDFNATGASADKNLPVILDRYIVVARALASIGINGFEINLVNADNAYLTPAYIEKEAALADALRPYGIRLSLAINYAAPTDPRFAPDVLTRDQMDPHGAAFQGWWNRRAGMLHDAIPDFAGFTVKASSEGQPGPEDFGGDQGDGANGMAAAVAPYGMQINWRTFVYNASIDEDRLKRAYLTFGYIDDEKQPDGSRGRFADNVLLQTKNGPLDYQAREPINPMFGRMENTNQALELEVTQEYTGQNTMLCYLAPMWEEALKTDTYATDAHGHLLRKRLVGNIVDGSAQGQPRTAMVGVANLGNADDLTGHQFSQANLFAFGRQAWDWTQSSRDIADDWTRMTWSNDRHVVSTIVEMMMGSREAIVNYQTPLGMAHQMRSSDHYGPNPAEWFVEDDYSPVYFNKADSVGLSYDRDRTGSDFVDQYFPVLANRYNDIRTTPDNLLAWFHHVPWGYRMRDGKTFWDDLVYDYQQGVQYVTWMRETWDSLQPDLDARRFGEVQAKLAQQETDASDWRDTLIGYWQEFSNRPIPTDHGPLSVKIQVAGKTVGGFDLSSSSYTIPVAAGASPRITRVIPADGAEHYQILSQADSVPGQAVVRVSRQSYFGPIVKNYVFQMVPDTTLSSLTVDGQRLASFAPDTTSYDAVLPPGSTTAPTVAAVADDPAAQVSVQQAADPEGTATVTVTNAGASTTYAVHLGTELTGSDEFTADQLGAQWHLVRPDPDHWRLADGSFVVNAQPGDLLGATNTAHNVALQDVHGDWTLETKVVFSRPLAQTGEQGGLIAYAGDDDYVKVAWEMANAGAPINKLHVALVREQGGVATTQQVTGADAQRIVGSDGAIWLRLAKAGDTYKAYYSSDGQVWRYFGTTSLSAPPTGAGLTAFERQATSTDLDAAFDYARIRSTGDRVR